MNPLPEFLNRQILEIGNYELNVANLTGALALIGLGGIANYLVSLALRRYTQDNPNLKQQGKFQVLDQLKSYVLWLLTALFVLQSLGVNVSLLIASSAALLVGVGFGIQGSVAEFLDGLSLMFGKTIALNDTVILEETLGRVRRIGFRTTEIITPLGQALLIPNSKLVEMTVQNLTSPSLESGFKIPLTVAYGSDARQVERLLIACAKEHSAVLETPQPAVFWKGFGDFGVELELRIWVKDSFAIEKIKSDVRLNILGKFQKAGVEIPFPRHVVTVNKSF